MPVQAALAEVVVLVEHADLGVGEVLLEVLAEDLALDRVVGLPPVRHGLGAAVVPARAARRDEQVRDLGRVEEADDLGVGRRAQALEDPEHLVLQHQLVYDVDGVGGVVGVVLDDQVQLAPVHPAVGVHVIEERLRGRSDLAVARRHRPRQRLMGPKGDAVGSDSRSARPSAARRTAAHGRHGHACGHRSGDQPPAFDSSHLHSSSTRGDLPPAPEAGVNRLLGPTGRARDNSIRFPSCVSNTKVMA